jgi:hypothetical protein
MSAYDIDIHKSRYGKWKGLVKWTEWDGDIQIQHRSHFVTSKNLSLVTSSIEHVIKGIENGDKVVFDEDVTLDLDSEKPRKLWVNS